MDREDFAAIRAGFSDFKALVMQSEVGKMRMMGLAVATGHHVVNYVAHLEQAQASRAQRTDLDNGNSAATPSPAKVDLSGLTRYECFAGGMMEPDEHGDFYKVADVQAALATPSPSLPPLQGAAVPAEPTVWIEGCNFIGKNPDGSDVFTYEGEDVIKRLTEIKMVGWTCYAPASAAAAPDELRKGIRAMASLLAEKEWADLLFDDADLAALEAEIAALVGAAAAPLLMDERESKPSGPPMDAANARKWMAAHGYGNQSITYALIDMHSRVHKVQQELRATLGASPSPKLPEGGEVGSFWQERVAENAAAVAVERGDLSKAYDEFHRLRRIVKTPGYCDGTKYTEREAFCMAVSEAGNMPPVAAPVSQQEASGEVLTEAEIISICEKEGLGPCMGMAVGRAIEAEVERRCRAQRTNNEVSRDEVFELAVQAVAVRAGERDSIPVINAFDAIRALKADRFALPKSADVRALTATPASAPAGGDARDAARYRWLRDKARSVDWNRSWTEHSYTTHCRTSPEQMDRAIDAAMTPPVSSSGDAK